jgi:hypothetical protein
MVKKIIFCFFLFFFINVSLAESADDVLNRSSKNWNSAASDGKMAEKTLIESKKSWLNQSKGLFRLIFFFFFLLGLILVFMGLYKIAHPPVSNRGIQLGPLAGAFWIFSGVFLLSITFIFALVAGTFLPGAGKIEDDVKFLKKEVLQPKPLQPKT